MRIKDSKKGVQMIHLHTLLYIKEKIMNEPVARLNEFAAASRGFRKIVQNGRNEGAQPLCPKAYVGTSSGEFRS